MERFMKAWCIAFCQTVVFQLFIGCNDTSTNIVDTPMEWKKVMSGVNGTSFTTKGSLIIAGTGYSGHFRSIDYGVHWKACNAGLENSSPGHYPSTDVFAWMGATLFASTHYSLFKSADDGVSWSKIGGEGGECMGVTDNYLINVGDYGTILISSNQGANWIVSPYTIPYVGVFDCETIGASVFLAASSGVYRSTDHGFTWKVVNNGLVNTWIISLKDVDHTLFAGTDGGVYSSSDLGDHWDKMTPGLSYSVQDFASFEDKLFAATRHGVYLSADKGATWNKFTIGMTDTMVNALAVSGNYLVAGANGGIWRCRLK